MDIKEVNKKLENTLAIFKSDLSGIQAGKVTEVLLKNVNVSYEDGRKVNLFATSTIKIASVKSISVHPFCKDDIMAVEKAINNAGLGVSTGRQDHAVIVTFPDITKERREELAKSINKFANEAKISSRDIRHNYLNANKKPSKEENVKLEKEIQKEIDKFNTTVDDLTKKKQQEIMKI